MEIQYYGANCLRITSKQVNITIDDNLKKLGLKPVAKPGDVVLFTGKNLVSDVKDPKLVIDMPGEYEVSTTGIQGVGVRGHMDDEKSLESTIYRIVADDARIAILGHIHPDITDDELEELGNVDILITPVGGHGYTLDAIGALKLIKKIEPKIVIPTHYADKDVKYEVPQAELTDVVKELGMEIKETLPKLKVKVGELPEPTQLIVLERS